MAIFPIRKQFQMIFMQNSDQIFFQNLDIMFPFFDKNLQFTTGGSIVVQQFKRIQTFEEKLILSYFPGKIYLQPGYIFDNDDQEYTTHEEIWKPFFESFEYSCSESMLEIFNFNTFTFINIENRITENNFFFSYQFSGWIRAIQIYQTDENFLYKLIKISSNSEDKRLTDDNLSPFQLLYKFEGEKQYIQILTYSYTFPSVNLDFSQNPFLIKNEILLTKNITLWHFLQVQFEDNQLKVDITFYDNVEQFNFNFLINVNHFHYMKFKIQFGNLFQNSLNYINFRLIQFSFIPCLLSVIIKSCESTCQQCAGPTKFDCLSCYPDSKRIYLKESKSCVCPENTVDQDGNCMTIENLIQPFLELSNSGLICQFGYFLLDEDTCVRCPSNPEYNGLFCLECIQNPYSWKLEATCKLSLYYNQSDNQIYKYIDEFDQIRIFTFDSTNLQLCQNCQQKNLENIDDIYNHYMLILNYQKNILQQKQQKEFENCEYIKYCARCVFINDQIICLVCQDDYVLENDRCKIYMEKQHYCIRPYYLNSRIQCSLCQIEYCIYCFEYLQNDLSKNTLYKEFEQFEINEFHSVGCALCNEGFQFNSLLGKCVFQQTNIQNCIRSFINLEGQEICTLSNLQTFYLSPEILNCQNKIPNCIQCIKTPSEVIKCIICEDGYCTSIKTGKCQTSHLKNSKICIQEDEIQRNAWIQLVQSFIMQFLNKNYFYPRGPELYIYQNVLSCKDGYQPSQYYFKCQPYCNSDCLKCAEADNQDLEFYCLECPLNSYNQIQRSTDNKTCIQCPKLCSICQVRSIEEIKSLNPYFVITDENIQYTYKCIQRAFKESTTIDSKLQIAKQVFGNETYVLNFNFDTDCNEVISDSQQIGQLYNYFEFCNQQGIENIQITVKYQGQPRIYYFCDFPLQLTNTYTSLKQHIFSLKFISLTYRGINTNTIENNLFNQTLQIQNFDQIKLEFMRFFLNAEIYFQFTNQDLIIFLLQNTIFSSDLQSINFYIQSTQIKHIDFTNLTFQSLNFTNTIMLNISGEYMENKIILNNIMILDCYFINSILISIFSTTQEIEIQNLTIQNSIFQNSSLLILHAADSFNVNGQFQLLELKNNKFFNSVGFQISEFEKFELRDIILSECYFLNSSLYSVMTSKIILDQLNILNNIFLTSSILISINQQLKTESIYEIANLNFYSNKFCDSFSFQIAPKYNQQHQNVSLYLNNLIIEKNQAQDIQIQSFILYMHCTKIQVKDIKISDQFNISFLYIYETENITIQYLEQDSSFQNKLIPLGYECQIDFNSFQIMKVYGFIFLKLENIKITRLNTLDLPYIELLSNIFWNIQQIEKILIQNVNFTENILKKQTIGKRLSLIVIFSENRQNIIFRENNFYYNLLHQTVDDSSDTVAGLIYIKSPQSNSEIFDFVSKSNWITNSSSSFFYAEVDFLSIINYKCENLNIFNQYFLENYLSIPIDFDQSNQEEIQLIVQKTVSIQTKGSACFAIVRKLQLINGEFKKIFSKTSPLFEIQTQSLGLIELQNLSISQIDVIYESNIDVLGSIYIYSLSSNLVLHLQNIEFDRVFNKFSSSIISITPSLRKNKLIFENVLIKNSISLINQILKIEFSQQNIQYNQIKFENLSIVQTEKAWIQYFKKIGQISYVDLEKIMNDNALINFANCKVTLKSVFIEGIFISPLIKIIDSVDLKIVNCKFTQIQTFYSFQLIQIEQNKQYSGRIQIFKTQFYNIQLFKLNITYIIENSQIKSERLYQKCLFNFDNFVLSKTNFSLNEIIILLQTSQNQTYGSLLYLQSLSNQTKLYISQLTMIENNCNFCNFGLVFINIVQIQKLQINELNCLKNQIIGFGCLNIKSNLPYNNKFELSKSIFSLNLGQQGTGVYFSSLKGSIKSSLIFNNSATSNTAGILINNQNNDFFFNNTLIFQNKGFMGGGLKIIGTSNINSSNFIQTFLEFNSANYLANNLIEAPTQLNLIINGQKMRAYQEISNNITINTLKLENYKLYQQDSLVDTKYLLIPSNQKIAEYKIFDQKNQVFKQYINELSLYFSNSYQEKLGDLNNQNCSVYQNIFLQNGSLVNQSEEFTLYFNAESNTIELGDLNFTFDPYEQNNLIQQIEIVCKINDDRALSYKINTKSFFCQLGEFYSQGGCQVCEANYGFYSVTFNATKCSIFDKTKFKAITSNTISLIPGFWRPNYLSDYPEQCSKNLQFCLGEWKVGDQSCLYGHIGGLCEECDFYNARGDGYFFKNPDNTGCLLCDESKSYIILFIFAALLAIISILVTLNSIATTNKLFASLKTIEKFGKIIFKLNQDHSSFLLKMFFNYLWIFSIIFTYNISFSINLNVVDQASNTSYFMANNLDCYLSSIQDANLIYIRIIGTIVFIFIQIILIYLILLILSKFKRAKFDYSNISNTLIYLYISNHASLTKQFCLLISERVISNISYVQGNVSLQFYTQNHQNWFYYFVLPGLSINGCVLPLLLIAILYAKRNQLDQIKVRRHICYLFNEYNDNSYYWEQIKIWQKTLIILIITYFEDKIMLKTTLLGLSLMLYQFLAIFQKPYIIQSLNKLDIQTGQICSITIFLAAVRSEVSSSNEALTIIQILIFVLFILLVYQYISAVLQAYVKKYKIIALQYIQILFKSISSKSTLCRYFSNLYSKEKSKRDGLKKNYDILRLHLRVLIKSSKIKPTTQRLISVKQFENYVSEENDSVLLKFRLKHL